MDFEKLYIENIKDAENLLEIAKQSNDIELMQRATKDKQFWVAKLQRLHNSELSTKKEF
jgi:hypothetical protein